MAKLEATHICIDAGEKRVVDDVSFSVATGEIHVLMGANGSGKSTLLNGMMGHPKYTASGGALLVDGKDILHESVSEKAKAGIFLSMQHIPEIKGVTLLHFLHRAYKTLHNSEVSVLDFHELLSKRADDIGVPKSFLERDVGVGLSGGEKKLSEVLQLAVLRPKFALLDEIDSGVDIDSLNKVFGAITALKDEGETGFLLVTHYNTLLNNVVPDKVHVMKEGKIVEEGDKSLVERIQEQGFSSINKES